MRMYHKLLMAIVLVSLLAMVLPASVATADEIVDIPDANLEDAIRDALNKPFGDIYDTELATLTTLQATGREIGNLTGLEYCTNLTTLWLSVNQINNTVPLSNLDNLANLYLSFNEISDVSALSSLTSLTTLDLRDNKISDISALSGLTSLTELHLSKNQISDVSVLSGLTNLTELYISNNQISEISALSSLISLTHFYAGNNTISDISVLSSLYSLDQLYLYENLIIDISPLVANAGLAFGDWVNLRHNPLSTDSVEIHIPALQDRDVTVFYDRGEGCFIATAAYGTSTAEEIDTLRAFRDEVLLESTVGSQLVEWYYQTSPPVADFISEHETLRTLVRECLVEPVAWLVEVTGTLWRG